MGFNVPPNIDKHTHYPSAMREGVMYMLKVGNGGVNGREKPSRHESCLHELLTTWVAVP